MNSCLLCNTEYTPTRNGQKYCSKKCYNKIANKKHSEYKKKWNAVNQDSLNISKQKWLENNPDKRKESSNTYRIHNRAYYNLYIKSRSSRVKQATPIWADLVDIINVYKEAEYLQLEVDHIIPIKHPLVCGLHVWSNLQLLSRSENAKKSNKFIPFDEDILGVVENG